MCYWKEKSKNGKCKLWRKNPRMMMRDVMFMKSKQRMILMHGHKSCEGKTLEPITFKLDTAEETRPFQHFGHFDSKTDVLKQRNS
ncbi:hypothetical protein JTB14_025226 [Gonioctena quinquepunctata]|nr:hypothetical protein JTB14_025226 [Gonioctena quinquepunctata]